MLNWFTVKKLVEHVVFREQQMGEIYFLGNCLKCLIDFVVNSYAPFHDVLLKARTPFKPLYTDYSGCCRAIKGKFHGIHAVVKKEK